MRMVFYNRIDNGSFFYLFFFFNDTATTEIYTLSLHDALPIWLLEIYDDVSLSVQSVFNDLKRLKPVKEGDPNGLVRLVNDIEMGYSQLKQIGNLECVTMIQVDEVCECLPPNIRDLWEEKYHSLSSSEKLHPFKAFMDFISIKRSVSLRRAEKPYTKSKSDSHGNSNQSDNKSKNARTFHSSVDSASSEQKKAERPDIKCVIHATEGSECKHSTEQCTDFGKLSLEDKREALKKYYACFRCFRTVHNRKWCKEKAPCKHCNKTNHHSFTTILRKLTQILSWCASAAVKDFSGMLCETD